MCVRRRGQGLHLLRVPRRRQLHARHVDVRTFVDVGDAVELRDRSADPIASILKRDLCHALSYHCHGIPACSNLSAA